MRRARPSSTFFGNNYLYGTLPPSVASLLDVASVAWSGTCITNASSAMAYCSMPELLSLVDLFSSTYGVGWVNATNWLVAGSNPCTWFGVSCSTASGPVT